MQIISFFCDIRKLVNLTKKERELTETRSLPLIFCRYMAIGHYTYPQTPRTETSPKRRASVLPSSKRTVRE